MAGTSPRALLGRYRVLASLSRTAESQVLLVEDAQRPSLRCALKILPVTGGRSFDDARRELEILRKVRHPRIAEVLDFGRMDAEDLAQSELAQDGGQFVYITSPFYEGLNLREAFLRLFPAPPGATKSGPRAAEPGERWRVFLEALARICEALDAIHSRGLIHHDIKPQNVLLVPSPPEGTPSSFEVKILDFGLAERATTPLGARRGGTVPFIAPEILEGGGADHRSDLFSLGVAIVFAVTGKFPFPGATPQAWIEAAVAGRRLRLRDLHADVPEELDRLVESLLAPRPADRPGSARVVAELLSPLGSLEASAASSPLARSFPTVGWEREIALLRGEIEQLGRGEASKVLYLFEGDSGQFLDPLLDEIGAIAGVHGARFESGHFSLPRKYAYQGLAEIVYKLSLDMDLNAPRLARYHEVLAAFIPAPLIPSPRAPLPVLKPRFESYRFLDLVTEFFLEAARDRPLVLCLRNLHLAGKESIDLLRFLARNVSLRGTRWRRVDERDASPAGTPLWAPPTGLPSTSVFLSQAPDAISTAEVERPGGDSGFPSAAEPQEPARILLVGSLREPKGERDSEVEVSAAVDSLSEICSEPYAITLRLENLSPDRISEWIHERAPNLSLEGELIRRLHDRSGGSPWLVSEFLHRLSVGGTARRGRAAQVEDDQPTAAGEERALDSRVLLRLPRSAEDSAFERMEGLAPPERQILEILAVAHGSLSEGELTDLYPPDGGKVAVEQDPALAAVLAKLEKLGLIDIRDGIGDPGCARSPYVVVIQPSLADQIYRQLPEDQRTLMHRRLAAMLGQRLPLCGPTRIPEDVAFHARLGGTNQLFIKHALVAAEKLCQAKAYDASAQLYEEVLERLAAPPPAEEGARGTPIDQEATRLQVIDRLATIHLGRGQAQRALEKLTLLAAAHEVLPSSTQLAVIQRRMGEVYQQNGELANAQFFFEKSLKILRAGLQQPAATAGSAADLLARERLLTLLSLARYHIDREALADAEKHLRECLETAQATSRHQEILCRAHVLMAEIERRHGNHSRSLAENLEALHLAQEDGEIPLLIEILGGVGWSYLGRGEYDKASEYFQKGLEAAQQTESKYDMAAFLSSLGTLHHNRADHERALECFNGSLSLSLQIGDLKGIANSYNNLGIVFRLKDELPRASECYKRAIDLFSRISDQSGMATGMNNLSSILELEGKYNEALDYSFRALDRRKKSRSRSGMAFCYYRIGKIYQAKGEIDKATAFAEKSFQIRKEIGEKLGMAFSRVQLAELYLSQGKYTETLHFSEAGLKDFHGLGNEVGELMAKELLARLHIRLGCLDDAQKSVAQILERSRQLEQRMVTGNCLLDLGVIARTQGRASEAQDLLSEAEKLFRGYQHRRELAEVLLEECALRLEKAEDDRAGSRLEEAYSILEELGVRDLVPLYFLLRGRLEMSGSRPDLESTAKFLERGLVEARELMLRDLQWQFHNLLGSLEARRGDKKLAKIHFQEAAELLEEAHSSLPTRFQATFYTVRKLDDGAPDAAATTSEAEPAPAQLRKTDRIQQPPQPPAASPSPVSDEVLALHQETLKLHEIAAAMGSERDIQKLLEGVMDAVLGLVDAERGFLILQDSTDDSRKVIVARNLDREEILDPQGKMSEFVAREVLRTGKPVLARNALNETRFMGSKSVRDLRLRSLVCVPLRFRGEVLGAIYLDNRHRRDAFRHQHLHLLQAFADQTAVAVKNAQLIEENRRRNAELSDANQQMEALNLKLRQTVQKRTAQLALVREDLRERQIQLEDRYRFQNMVGRSQAMRQIFFLLERIAATALPVLLEGESGTGKELIARAIHFNSAHKEGRFVSLNCGALTESLLESELFGHTRGAFTGAIADKKGLFELADTGSLFLDEVADMSLGMQQKLLRVLQEGEIRRVGGKDNIRVNVRVISASNKDLRALVAADKFREDLYYRINGIPIRVPSLRDRKEDIPLLVQHFVEAGSKPGAPLRLFQPEALRALMTHDWPGNVRELRHLVERTLLIAPGEIIREEDLLFDTPRPTVRPPPGWEEDGEDGRLGIALEPGSFSHGARRAVRVEETLGAARDSFEKAFLARCLREAGGNVSAAARRCRISRESFYRLMRKHRLEARGRVAGN